MNIKIIITKGIVSLVIWITYFELRNAFYPILTNTQALKQLEDNSESFVNFTLYQQFWNYIWIIPIIITILIFKKEIVEFYYKIKNNLKENF